VKVAELEDAVRRVRLTGLFKDARLEVFRDNVGGIVVQITMAVPHRDTGRLNLLHFREVLEEYVLEGLVGYDPLDFLHRFVSRFAQHEADEAIVIDGRRPFDPHRHETHGQPMNPSGGAPQDGPSAPHGLAQTTTVSGAGPSSGARKPDHSPPGT
jgi:hypothetical protein